jgi:AraC family transcriptional regulator
MTPFDETAAVVGCPLFMHTIGELVSPGAVVARWRHNGAELDISPTDVVRVTIGLQDGVPVWQGLGNSELRPYVTAIGGVSVTPAHTRVRIAIDGPADVLQLFLRVSFLESAIDRPFDCLPIVNSRDSELRAAAIQLVVAATRGNRDDTLLLESAARRIGNRLLNRDDHPSREPARGGLARLGRLRVDDLIIASLDDTKTRSPTLDQLASAASLSVNHFIRAFRQQTGMTPHQYVVLRRLERGIAMLKKPGASVSEVADILGFATPAHFVATFRRMMGVTPGAFRAAVLS